MENSKFYVKATEFYGTLVPVSGTNRLQSLIFLTQKQWSAEIKHFYIEEEKRKITRYRNRIFTFGQEFISLLVTSQPSVRWKNAAILIMGMGQANQVSKVTGDELDYHRSNSGTDRHFS
jgi:hypothetical protein